MLSCMVCGGQPRKNPGAPYMGKWDSEEDWAEHIIDECYDLEGMMGHLASFFNYEAYARELFIEDYYFTDGFVFRR